MFINFGAIVGKFLQLKRTCPKCKKVQIVPEDMKHKTVSCKFCKEKIAPQKNQSS